MPEPLVFPQRHSIDPGFEVFVLDDEVAIKITNDWAGDSLTGFGAEETYYLDRDQATQLRDWLDAYLNEPRP